MISTGIHKWGFVIYRCTYDDDELWSRYLAQLKEFYHSHLAENRRAELLEQYLDWVVIEDRPTLDNASRPDIRRRFNQWVLEQDVPKLPVSLLTYRLPIQLPRFQYCIYVDKECLNTVTQFQEANDGTSLFPAHLPPMVLAIIDRTWTPDGTEDDDERGYPLIDGSDRKYVGWMYCNAFYVGVIYEDFHQGGLDDNAYHRPPSIYPRNPRTMPIC
ncbi:hypothetical protein LY76DRAFT_512970 [Colletotrichum caudatum]|nr:hypothetical protein LY76DRAFT_512970 [Colletotrichum caudatum]